MSFKNLRKKNIAIIGAGVAGITTAHLLYREHNVTLYERNDYLGGHTNTRTIERGPDSGAAIDTGFIVLNNRTYPLLHRLLKQLDVPVRKSEMSFSYWDASNDFLYAGTDIFGLFADKKNILKASFYRFLFEIAAFNKGAKRDLRRQAIGGMTLGDYLKEKNSSPTFIEHYLLPMGAAIWSSSQQGILDFPAMTFLSFFENHGLLDLPFTPLWQTVVGGSRSYVEAFKKSFNGTVRLSTSLESIARNEDLVTVRHRGGEEEKFDFVILATHADEALSLLADPSEAENKLLGPWEYHRNETYLHTDGRFLPPTPRAWAAWNYIREESESPENPVTVTYYMNRLQGLECKENYCVTLNPTRPPAEETVHYHTTYTHPAFTSRSIATQTQLPSLNGVNRTFFCGSYFGFGFHEDAVRSAVRVANLFGETL